jgi:hypothetical protein
MPSWPMPCKAEVERTGCGGGFSGLGARSFLFFYSGSGFAAATAVSNTVRLPSSVGAFPCAMRGHRL